MKSKLLMGAVFATAALFGTVAATGVMAPTPAWAADKGEKLSAAVGKPLQAAQELAGKQKYKEAVAKVREAEKIPNKTAYESYVINQMLAFTLAGAGDYGGAARAYEAVITSGRLSGEDVGKSLKNTANLYYQAENYSKAAQYGSRYLSEIGPNSDIQLLVAQSYYLAKDNANAYKYISQAVSSVERNGGRPDENWLKLQMATAHGQNDRAGTTAALEKLVTFYPKPTYWDDLLENVLGGQGLNDRLFLEVYRLKQATGVLRAADDYMEMAQIAIQLGLPGEAQGVLQKGFANKVLGKDARHQKLLDLANQQAGVDKPTLANQDKQASAQAKGEALVRLGEAYASYGMYDKAVSAITRGIQKGGVNSLTDARIQLGRAYLGAKNTAQARATFKLIENKGALGRLGNLWEIYSNQSAGA